MQTYYTLESDLCVILFSKVVKWCFFSKHIGIVGSTGSGKSCTVAKILQEAVGIQEAGNINILQQKNAHIIIFDIHSEYKSAFTLTNEQ